jgi:hypothetical protein
MRFHRPLRSLALATLVACALPVAARAAALHVGHELTVAEATPIADILAAPDSLAGKRVRIEGEVAGVCTKMGCWMDLADGDGRRIRINVEEGVVVIPPDATGKPAVAEGTVTVEDVTREQYVEWQKHLAHEGGPAFDETKVGDGPFRLVQLAGDGATIGD